MACSYALHAPPKAPRHKRETRRRDGACGHPSPIVKIAPHALLSPLCEICARLCGLLPFSPSTGRLAAPSWRLGERVSRAPYKTTSRSTPDGRPWLWLGRCCAAVGRAPCGRRFLLWAALGSL